MAADPGGPETGELVAVLNASDAASGDQAHQRAREIATALGDAGEPLPPNNWVSFFGGPGWEWVPERGQFYYHTFLVGQPELEEKLRTIFEERKDKTMFLIAMARLDRPQAPAEVVDRVAEVALKRGVPRAQVALAWLAQKPFITAPIVGASKPHHLDDAVAALTLKLTPEEISSLEEPYVPHAVVGF